MTNVVMKKHPDTEIDFITFDNDLGTGRPEGYDIVKVMIEDGWNVKDINLHTANVVARRNMLQILESAMRHKMMPQIGITEYPLLDYAEFFRPWN